MSEERTGDRVSHKRNGYTRVEGSQVHLCRRVAGAAGTSHADTARARRDPSQALGPRQWVSTPPRRRMPSSIRSGSMQVKLRRIMCCPPPWAKNAVTRSKRHMGSQGVL